jgi:hypothetical protein
MQKRIMSVLCAAITGAILIASVSARASSDLDADLLYVDPPSLRETFQIERQELPDSLSFKFASLYNRIKDTAARIAAFTLLDRATRSALGVNFGFESLDQSADVDRLELDAGRSLIPGVDNKPDEGFTLRIDMSDDHAPLLDPSPRQPDEPLKDKIWIALGARYHHSDRLLLDIGYEHLWVNETTFNRQGGLGDDIMGDYRSEMDLVGARLRWAFD